jgi:hypothetical protein
MVEDKMAEDKNMLIIGIKLKSDNSPYQPEVDNDNF